MGFFFRRKSRPNDTSWHPIDPADVEGDAFQLHADGRFSIVGMTFEQSCSMTNCSFGGAMFNKKSGEGEALYGVLPNRRPWEFLFENGRWYASSKTLAAVASV